MNKGFIIGVASVIIGCIGFGYALGTRRENNDDESDDVRDERTNSIIDKCFEGVERYMNRKADVKIECINFGKDILANRSYRLTIGLTVVGLGVGLIASAYIPLPA